MDEIIERSPFQSTVIAVLEYLLMFFFIIEFNTPYTYFPIIAITVKYLCVFLLFLLTFIRFGKFKIEPMVVYVLIGALIPLLNVADYSFKRYFWLYIVIFPLSLSYMIPLIHEDQENAKKMFLRFSNIVFVLALISLVFWYWGSMRGDIPYTTLIPNDWGEDRFIPTYYGVYFETQSVADSQTYSSVARNSGIFNEAPMHNMILCTALAVECFLRDKISKIRIVVLIATILTTISSTGFFFLTALSVVNVYVRANQYRNALLTLTPVIIGVGLFVSSAIMENKKDTGESSLNSRIEDIEKCIMIGMENPILGIEIMHKADEFGSNKVNFGYSNSTFTTFAHGGLYLLLLYIAPLFIVPIISLRRQLDWRWSLMMFFYFLLFTFTVSHYKYLTMLFVAYGIAFWNEIDANHEIEEQDFDELDVK